MSGRACRIDQVRAVRRRPQLGDRRSAAGRSTSQGAGFQSAVQAAAVRTVRAAVSATSPRRLRRSWCALQRCRSWSSPCGPPRTGDVSSSDDPAVVGWFPGRTDGTPGGRTRVRLRFVGCRRCRRCRGRCSGRASWRSARISPTQRTWLDAHCWVDQVHGWLGGQMELYDRLARADIWHRAERPMYGQMVAEPRLSAGMRVRDRPDAGDRATHGRRSVTTLRRRHGRHLVQLVPQRRRRRGVARGSHRPRAQGPSGGDRVARIDSSLPAAPQGRRPERHLHAGGRRPPRDGWCLPAPLGALACPGRGRGVRGSASRSGRRPCGATIRRTGPRAGWCTARRLVDPTR